MSVYFDLYDYRQRVAALYSERRRALEAGEEGEQVWRRFHTGREALFREHPSSALDEGQRRVFVGLPSFPYRADLCVPARVETGIAPLSRQVAMDSSEQMTMTAVARLQFAIEGQPVELVLYWLEVYGGGLFLPFRDATCPGESYGGGRYLFDTIKGSDFLSLPGPAEQKSILLDFNYAYNPSCAYNDRWVCPLAPQENHLHVAIPAGEKKFRT